MLYHISAVGVVQAVLHRGEGALLRERGIIVSYKYIL